MEFLQSSPPDTSAYMIAGYAVFFCVFFLYITSMFVRNRNLKRDLETLNDVTKE